MLFYNLSVSKSGKYLNVLITHNELMEKENMPYQPLSYEKPITIPSSSLSQRKERVEEKEGRIRKRVENLGKWSSKLYSKLYESVKGTLCRFYTSLVRKRRVYKYIKSKVGMKKKKEIFGEIEIEKNGNKILKYKGREVEIRDSVGNLYEIRQFSKKFEINELEKIIKNVEDRNIKGIAWMAKLIKEGKIYVDWTSPLGINFRDLRKEERFAIDYVRNLYVFWEDFYWRFFIPYVKEYSPET